jgi:hypothetical protein
MFIGKIQRGRAGGACRLAVVKLAEPWSAEIKNIMDEWEICSYWNII